MKNATFILDHQTIARLKKLATFGKRSASATIRYLVAQEYERHLYRPLKGTK